jgi:hypothetical protein
VRALPRTALDPSCGVKLELQQLHRLSRSRMGGKVGVWQGRDDEAAVGHAWVSVRTESGALWGVDVSATQLDVCECAQPPPPPARCWYRVPCCISLGK